MIDGGQIIPPLPPHIPQKLNQVYELILWRKSLVDSQEIVRQILLFLAGVDESFRAKYIYQEDFGASPAPIRKNPSEVKNLSRPRTTYWDDIIGTVVIIDPGDADFGTAFRPAAGK